MKNYYVYLIEDIDSGEFYIGSRGCSVDPSVDKYLGSPYIWKPNISKLKKKILKNGFDSMESAILFEREVILENINNPLNRNYAVPNPKWNRDGKILAKDVNGKVVTISKNDPLFGVDFVGITKGLVLVKDKDNNTFYVSKEDERYLSGELIHNNIGLVFGENHQNYGKRYIYNNAKQILVDQDELEYYLNNGWYLGTLQKGKTTNSSHCNTIWVNNGGLNKRLDVVDLKMYLEGGWKLGRVGLKKYKKRNE